MLNLKVPMGHLGFFRVRVTIAREPNTLRVTAVTEAELPSKVPSPAIRWKIGTIRQLEKNACEAGC
jgi:hypothetical protein